MTTEYEPGSGPLPKPSTHSLRDRIIDATMESIAFHGWQRLSLHTIATAAGVSMLDLYREFGSKQAILSALLRRTDEAVLATPVDAQSDERPRDRVFDLLMRRFDALTPYRDAFAVLARELPRDPLVALGTGARLLHSIAWMLEAGGIAATGVSGIIAVKLTAAAYLATARVWLRDESPDLASTMAILDRRLRGIERWYGGSRSPPPRDVAAPA